MQSFKIQIEDLIGDVADDTLISSAIQDIGAELVSVSPIQKLKNYIKTTAISSSGLNIASKKIITVEKGDYIAKEIGASDKAKYKDTGSIYASADTDPVYYVEAQSVFVIGAASGNETSGVLHFIPNVPTYDGDNVIVHGSTSVEHFPKDGIPLIVLGGAIRCLQRAIADRRTKLLSYVQTDEDPEMAQTEMLEVQAAQTQLQLMEAQYTKSLDIYSKTN